MAESQTFSALDERLFDDPSQLSQLLRQRASSNRVVHFTTSTESNHSATVASGVTFAISPQRDCAIAEQQLPVVPALGSHAPSPRRVATTRNVKPALFAHHSAPTSTGFIKEMDGALKMHHSFAGMDTPGDTQPDSQIYKQWTSGIHGTGDTFVLNKMNTPKSLFTDHVEEDEGDSPIDPVEMVESSQEHHSPTVTSPTVVHEDDSLGVLPPGNYALTSPLKFETPGMVGRKRDSSGQILSSAMRTNTTPGTVISAAAFPGFANGGVAPMSLTQAWQNTQAPTSPVVAESADDVAFTRPSPNFTHVRHSSPIPAYSSPIKGVQVETPRTDPVIRSSSEPRAEYVSMKESQERRKRTTREQPLPLPDEDSWEKPTAAQWRVQRKKLKDDLDRQAAMSFMHISAPGAHLPQKATGKTKLSSPTRSKSSNRAARIRRDEGEEDSTDKLAQAIGSSAENDDLSPDELSHDVPSSARVRLKHNSTNNSVQVPKTSSHPIRTQSGQSPGGSPQNVSASSQLQRESQPQAPAFQSQYNNPLRPQSSKDSVAIMDSQPEATADYESMPRPKSLRFPSSPSANNYSINQTTMTKTGYTSQVISSSMPPMPPSSSPKAEEPVTEDDVTPDGEKRFPSSPPIAGPDDIMYDEHENAYDEYDEEAAVHESVEPEAVEEDVEMAEDDDLPLTKPAPDGDEMSMVEEEQDELDLVEPQKIDFETEQEVPETLEKDDVQVSALDEEEPPPRSSRAVEAERRESMPAPEAPRTQRQNTVPETDALEETQPSFFPTDDSIIPADENQAHSAHVSTSHNQTNSTELFHTAREQASGSQNNEPPPASSKDIGSDTIRTGERLRSLQDVYDLPETQRSLVEEEIEMPRLSGLDDHDDDNLMAPSSPASRSTKRRKVTYTAKHNIFRSPLKSTTVSDAELDQPPSSPPPNIRGVQVDDPASALAQEREQQGAHAAEYIHDTAQAPYTRQASLKSKPAPRPSRVQASKKGALKPVPMELLHAMSSPHSPARTGSRRNTPITPTKRDVRGRGVDVNVDVDMPDIDEERDELAETTPEPDEGETVIRKATDRGETPAGDVMMPNRVLAPWPGSHFYPATCLGGVAGRQLQIRFDDGNTTNMDATQIRALDLRPGDHVKVDETGMKKHTYVVVGFKDKLDDLGGEKFPATDRYGYATIVLEEKSRDSLSKAKAVRAAAEPIEVPLTSIYLTTNLWTRLRDRSFNFSPAASPVKVGSRIGTPVTAVDPLATPSFSRRGTTVPSLLKDATTRAGSVTSSSTRSSTGVFSNMAFVLTSTAADVDKEAIARVLKTNGGQVLEQGFHELFDYESSDAPPSSQIRRRSTSVEGPGLSLKPVYQDLGFVALISDSFSRSTKYIQALALNVPCLHLRWVQDSLSASRAAPFARYLLPAGVSKFLDPNGVVRSRTMTVYDPAADDMSFAETVAARDLLLHNQTVLLVTGKSKKEIEKRQPFVFLTHALGSANVGRCADLSAAAEMLANGQWDWVHVDFGEAGVADAAAELFGTGRPVASGKAKKGKKRKRDDTEEKEELVKRGEIGGKEVKITCSEFVIQSLVLGALVEE